MALNPAQQKAVTETGVQLVLAGPGSGKTRVITEKILYLIQNGVPPEKILALTFSEKAAEEMLERLEWQTNTADLTVSTFHSFALSVLEDNILDSGLSFNAGVISRANQLVWGLKNIDSFGFTFIEVGNNAIEVIESIIDGISAFRDELISPDELDAYLAAKKKNGDTLSPDEQEYLGRLTDLLKVYRAYERYKREENLLDYDDMIHETVKLFAAKPHILRRYRLRFSHVLVDEFQDTNYAQLALIKQLAGDHLCVVGDDDQTIYRFRGAYLTNMQDFKDYFASCNEILLDYNYRNTQTILSLALQLMQLAPNRREKKLITKNPPGDPVVVAMCGNEPAEVAFVLGKIRELAGKPFYSRTEEQERPLQYRDIAIICRRRMEGVKFYKALKQNGIPAEFVGEVDFFATPVIRDVLAYLRTIKNPLVAGIPLNRILKINGVPETTVQKINVAAKKIAREEEGNDGVFEAMQNAEVIVPDDSHLILDVVSTLNHLIELKDQVTLTELVHALTRTSSDLYRSALTDESGQALLLLNTFARITTDYEAITREPALADFLSYLALLAGFSVEVGEREEKESVKVLTVHKSKGKEFPVVFVVDMVQGKFPLRYQAKPFSVPNDLARGLKTADDEKALFLQEERRLCYVAMTRAQDRLYLVLAKRYGDNKNPSKPSQFLFEMRYETNPLVKVKAVPASEEPQLTGAENVVEDLKRRLKDQAHAAIEQMHFATAVQRIVELEKVRLLEEKKPLDTFDPAQLLPVPTDDAGLLSAFCKKPIPLIGKGHTFSASALTKYEECPLCYKFLYVLQVPKLEKTYFSMGSAVHRVIELLSAEQQKGVQPTFELALRFLDSCWSSRAYASKTHEQEDRTKAEAMLGTYLAWQKNNKNTIIGTEKRFTFTLDGRVVKGFIDRIEKTPDGGYVLIDFKTGSKPSSMTKNSIRDDIQMNLYCLAVQQMYGTLPKRASLYYLKENTLIDYVPTKESIAAFEKNVSALVDAVCAEQFTPSPSYTCRWCDYQDLCEAKEAGD